MVWLSGGRWYLGLGMLMPYWEALAECWGHKARRKGPKRQDEETKVHFSFIVSQFSTWDIKLSSKDPLDLSCDQEERKENYEIIFPIMFVHIEWSQLGTSLDLLDLLVIRNRRGEDNEGIIFSQYLWFSNLHQWSFVSCWWSGEGEEKSNAGINFP